MPRVRNLPPEKHALRKKQQAKVKAQQARIQTEQAKAEAKNDPLRAGFCEEIAFLMARNELPIDFSAEHGIGERIGELFGRIVKSRLELWSFEAEIVGGRTGEERDVLRATMADAAARHLSGMKPGIVRRQAELVNLVKGSRK